MTKAEKTQTLAEMARELLESKKAEKTEDIAEETEEEEEEVTEAKKGVKEEEEEEEVTEAKKGVKEEEDDEEDDEDDEEVTEEKDEEDEDEEDEDEEEEDDEDEDQIDEKTEKKVRNGKVVRIKKKVMSSKEKMNRSKAAKKSAKTNKAARAQAAKSPAAKKKRAKSMKIALKQENDPTVTSEDVDSILEKVFAEEQFSTEFFEKARTILEAYLGSKVVEMQEDNETILEARLEEAVTTVNEELETNADKYLSYVAEQWIAKNELAVEKGLQTQISESFIAGLKNLFEDHNISLPEEQVDVLEKQAEEIQRLEENLSEEINQNAKLALKVQDLDKKAILAEASEELSLTETDKLQKLAEAVEFKSAEEFSDKVEIIKESFFDNHSKSTVVTEESVSDADAEDKLDAETKNRMDLYNFVISKKSQFNQK